MLAEPDAQRLALHVALREVECEPSKSGSLAMRAHPLTVKDNASLASDVLARLDEPYNPPRWCDDGSRPKLSSICSS